MTNFKSPTADRPIPWRHLDAETWTFIRSLSGQLPRKTPEGRVLDFVPEDEFVRRIAMCFDARVVDE